MTPLRNLLARGRLARARRLDAYAARLCDPASTPDELRRLRRELRVSRREHAAMESLLRAVRRPMGAGELLHGRFRMHGVLAEGGSGRTHLATDATTGALVVVKLVHDGDAAREARMAARVRSPHVVRVLDAGTAGDGAFLAMEYAEGGTLADRLARTKRLGEDETLRLAKGLLAGLAAAHAAGVVHADVKPENVLFTRDDEVLLADFGASRAAGAGATRDLARQATVLYASPEQLRGEPATPRSDVWSAAAVLHRCLLGRPHAAWDEVDDVALAEASPRLAPVLVRALARDPEARFEDAARMLAAARGEVDGLVVA